MARIDALALCLHLQIGAAQFAAAAAAAAAAATYRRRLRSVKRIRDQIFEYGGHKDGGCRRDALVGVLFFEQRANAADGKNQLGVRRLRDRFASRFFFSRFFVDSFAAALRFARRCARRCRRRRLRRRRFFLRRLLGRRLLSGRRLFLRLRARRRWRFAALRCLARLAGAAIERRVDDARRLVAAALGLLDRRWRRLCFFGWRLVGCKCPIFQLKPQKNFALTFSRRHFVYRQVANCTVEQFDHTPE